MKMIALQNTEQHPHATLYNLDGGLFSVNQLWHHSESYAPR